MLLRPCGDLTAAFDNIVSSNLRNKNKSSFVVKLKFNHNTVIRRKLQLPDR